MTKQFDVDEMIQQGKFQFLLIHFGSWFHKVPHFAVVQDLMHICIENRKENEQLKKELADYKNKDRVAKNWYGNGGVSD